MQQQLTNCIFHLAIYFRIPKSRLKQDKFGNPLPWCPENSDDKYGGFMTLKDALANSVNTITARVMDQVGP